MPSRRSILCVYRYYSDPHNLIFQQLYLFYLSIYSLFLSIYLQISPCPEARHPRAVKVASRGVSLYDDDYETKDSHSLSAAGDHD